MDRFLLHFPFRESHTKSVLLKTMRFSALLILSFIPAIQCRSPAFTDIYEETAYHGKFCNLTVIHFKDRHGKSAAWEVQDVKISKNPSGVAGVYTIVKAYKENQLYFMFNKQYRLPTRSWTVEFPGGIIDKGESAMLAGIRELREETGFSPSWVDFVSPGKQASFPSRSNDLMKYVVLTVKNAHVDSSVESDAEGTEDVEVIFLRADRLLQELDALGNEVMVSANVYSFALAWAMKSDLI